jgi:hypothetical protein
MEQRAEWMVKSEGDLAEELHCVQQVWEQIGEVLGSIPESADKRTKQTIDRAMSLDTECTCVG